MLDRVPRSFLHVSSLVATFAMLLLSSRTVSAATTILGGNLGNQTWTLAGSPYLVMGDATVQVGATLTIQPGVAVQLANTDGQRGGRGRSLRQRREERDVWLLQGGLFRRRAVLR
jgi:hypothetical protein